MCNRYSLGNKDTQPKTMKDIIKDVQTSLFDKPYADKLHIDGDIRITNLAPIITREGATAMTWGFIEPWSKSPLFNARSETILEKPTWKRSALERRCLIPMASFYEYLDEVDEKGHKTKVEMCVPNKKLVYAAGVYKPGKEGEPDQYSMVTTDAAPSIHDIHDRMPIILSLDARRIWMGDTITEQAIAALLSEAVQTINYYIIDPAA